MRSNIKFIIVLITSSIFFFGCEENKEHEEDHHSGSGNSDVVKLSEASVKEIGLSTEIISLKPFTGSIRIPATVLADQDNEAQVGSLVQGRVHKVFKNIGDYVKAGQELMLVEGLEIGEIQAGFLSAKANLEYKKAAFERQKLLLEQNAGSQKSFLEAQAEYEKALAEYDGEDKKIHSIGLNDKDVISGNGNGTNEHTSGTLPVKSPIDGIVVERNVVIGQLVDGTSNAFKIINTGSLWVDGQIYEKDIDKIKKGTNVIFTSAAYPDQKFTGRIIYAGQTIDEKSRTIKVRAQFSNPNNKLKPQMFGELHIPAEDNSTAILIPSESIIKIDNADYVFVKKEGLVFEKRAVVAGYAENEMIEIREGLKKNDEVVVKGAFFLKSELMKDELAEDEH